MKASYRDHYCPPAQIQLKDIPKPTPKGDEVLIRVMATTVNRTDVGVATGKPYAIRAFAGLSRPKIPVTGTDFAGVIEAVGSEVQNFKIGDRVWGCHERTPRGCRHRAGPARPRRCGPAWGCCGTSPPAWWCRS